MKKRPRSLDEQIKKAIEDGAFDDLPGKGKPMDLSENPFEDPSWRMANRILRASGFSLPWIEKRKGIETEYNEAADEIKRTWQWRLSQFEQNHLEVDVDGEWSRALEKFRNRISDLNKRIFNYNLETPLAEFKIRKIKYKQEIDRIMSEPD